MATTGLPLTVPDVVCMLDVDAFGRETQSDLETLEQDVFHRLIEKPGTNPDDETLGIGVEESLAGGVEQLAQIQRRIDQQLGEDTRIDACQSTLIKLGTGDYTLNLRLVVDGSVVGLAYTYTKQGGLQPA